MLPSFPALPEAHKIVRQNLVSVFSTMDTAMVMETIG